MLAPNAEPILKARLRGFKPDGLTLVSLIGPVDVANHVVRAIPGTVYDWRWVHRLEVCVYVGGTQDWAATVKAIAAQRPSYLCIWNPQEQWGAQVYLVPTLDDISKPVSAWAYELDFLPWLDFQNRDFLEGRTYARNAGGIPYAVNP